MATAGMWQTRCEEAERAKAQALREAAAWKKKYIAERERRREMTKTLVVVLQQEQNKTSQNEALVRRFASILSDPNETSAILSPTLPSFDLDGDDEDSTDDEQGPSSRGRHTSPPPLHLLLDQPPATVPTRSVRSSTMDIGHAPFSLSPRHDAKEEGQAMMLNLLYARTFHAGYRSSSKRLQTLAKSITCFHGKRDRIFEHFFIAGIPASSSAIEPVLEGESPVGFWKPAILFQYPPAAVYPLNDQAVSGFCFPVGAPAFSCSVADAESLRGSLISQWTSDAASCFRQLLEPFNAQTYTFRLTGSKGEALYGLCAAVLMDADDPPLLLDSGHLDAMNSDSDADGVAPSKPRSLPRDATFHSLAGILASPLTDKDGAFFEESPVVLTPRSYCVTSKYPFYKLHYHFLRTLIEADMRSRQVAREAQSALHRPTFVDVTVHQSLLGLTLKRKDDVGPSEAGLSEKDVRLLDAIATPATKAPDGSVTLTDDRRAMAPPPTKDVAPRVFYRSRSWSASGKKRALPLSAAAARPRVQAIVDSVEASMGKAGVRVGDLLVAINGFPIGDLAFAESLRLLDSAKRPLKLRFQRIVTKAPRRASSNARLERGRGSSTVLELLRRYRSMKVGEAGSWTSVRLGHCDVKYQFPTARTDEWTVAVLLSLLSADNIVLVLGHLLLEKQVAIVSDSTAKLAAVSAAFVVLLRPFQWQSTYIPVLPSSLLDFLHSPVPYLVGVHNGFAHDEWPDVCFVHVEADDVASPFAPTPFPTSRELETVLSDCQAKMRALPARPPHPWHDLSDAENDVLSLAVAKTEYLFSTLCGAITTLPLLPHATKSSYDVLQEEFEKATAASVHRHFYAEFAQTQLFCQYCEAAMHDVDHASTPTR